MTNNIGINVTAPKKECNDPKCPFHGSLKVRGRILVATVISTKMRNTATIEWTRRYALPKYERYEKRISSIAVHNPECIHAQDGDLVKIMECRPLSKTKNFVIIENLGKVRGFEQRAELMEESKFKEKPKEEKKEEPPAKKPEPAKEE